MFGFDGARRSNYFGGEVIRRTEVKFTVGKPVRKDKIKGKML